MLKNIPFSATTLFDFLHTLGWLRCSGELLPDGSLKIRGAIALPNTRQGTYQVMVNDSPAKQVTLNLPGDPIFHYHGYHPLTGDPGFEFIINANEKPPFRIWIADKNGNRINHWYQDWIHLPPTSLPFPSPDLQLRNNATSDDWYHFGGGTFAAKLPDVIKRYDTRSPNDFRSVLDWGCGTGRITRHLPAIFPHATITAVDIDSEAIHWMQATTPGIDCKLSPPNPPMPIRDGSIDLVISHSVFSHIDENSAFKWLEDLHRITAPNGLVLASTLSHLAPFILPIDKIPAEAFSTQGFCCFDNKLVEYCITKEGYSVQRLAYQSYEYIKQKWSAYFEIIDILDGYADFLALVVMRKRD